MNKNEIYVSGIKVTLGKRIGQGGEGDVYSLNHSAQLALKLYTLKDLGDREDKIKAMVAAGLSKSVAAIAFPVAIATVENNKFAGFVMPFVAGHKPIHQLYSPAPRKRYFPKADYRFLIRTALNVSKAIEAVHKQNCVIGDVNHSGILISDKATAVLIDADSFQFVHAGKTFLCKVGVPEYTPPELQGKKLSKIVRTPNNDAFALAVLVFQILFMGRHPFAGTYTKGEMSLETAIAEYRFAYSKQRQTDMQQPPGTVGLEDLPDGLSKLFEQAFSKAPERPSANAWVEGLKEFEKNIRVCNTNSRHFFYRLAPKCPWCRIEEASGVDLFPQNTVSGFKPPDLGNTSIFDQVAAIHLPTLDVPPTIIAQFRPSPASKPPKQIGKYFGAAGIVAVAILIVAAKSDLWWISGALVIWALAIISSTKGKPVSDFLEEIERLDRELSKAVLKWRESTHLIEAYALKVDMHNLKAAYASLPKMNVEILDYLRSTRQQRALSDYLDKHFIQHAKITGFGPSKIRLISSYGFDTAGDLKRRSVTSVPGIGPTFKSYLDAWVADIEHRFIYKPTPNEDAADHAIASKEVKRIEDDILREAIDIQRRIFSITGTIQSALKQSSADLTQLIEQRQQLAGEIIVRGGIVPTFSIPTSAVPFRSPKKWNYNIGVMTKSALNLPRGSTGGLPPGPAFPRTGTPLPPPKTSPATQKPKGTTSRQTPNCPNCGKLMIMRTAKRGHRRGRQFWGCSNYPRCKGTKPV
jgi:DNA-binding helix-hairpin-helix protein with protein kinase domain